MTDQTNFSQQKTLGQRRAADAWERVKSVKGKSSAKEYSSLVRGLPAMIQSQGLAPALSFLKAKGKEHHKDAYKHVSNWVMHEINPKDQSKDLLEWVLSQDSVQYRRATTIALAYVNYLKRFAEVEEKSDEDTKKGGNDK